MSNIIKNIDIKNHTYYFSHDIINITNFDPNKIKIDENSHKNILICHFEYATIRDSKYLKTNKINPL